MKITITYSDLNTNELKSRSFENIFQAEDFLNKLKFEEVKYKYSESKYNKCEKCVHYYTHCLGGPTCPPGMKYQRDPPDGGYYG